MILVVDASVAIKWFLHVRDDETHSQQALDILAGIAAETVDLIQPPHFIGEVAAVLAREKPNEALADLTDLINVEFRIAESSAIYATACELAIRLKHHLFDTLYHAVALHAPGAILITADETYHRKAQSIGCIRRLQDYSSGWVK
jgi:predicted nucleic acid-binding protein